jgi:hypothetical protein
MEECVQITTTEMKPDIKRITQAKALSNISLMTNFVKKND